MYICLHIYISIYIYIYIYIYICVCIYSCMYLAEVVVGEGRHGDAAEVVPHAHLRHHLRLGDLRGIQGYLAHKNPPPPRITIGP